MSTSRTLQAGLAALGLGLSALAGQASASASEPLLPSVSSSAVTQTYATLDARIDTGGMETTYRFEYGTSAAYGASVPEPDADAGSEGTVNVGQEITSLQPGTTYHYRAVASNASGRVIGGDETFTTPPLAPPIVGTGQASGVAQNAATLSGTVDARGFETVYEFDIGVDTSYGTRIFGDAGVEPGAQTFAFALQGLAPATTYHYRIAATNTFGTSYGVDQTFTTASYPSAALTPPATPPLEATPLLAVAGAGTAKASSLVSVAHAARRVAGKGGARSKAPKGKGVSRRIRTPHHADRKGTR